MVTTSGLLPDNTVIQWEKGKQQELFAIFSSNINPELHISTKINTFIRFKGGLGEAAKKDERCVGFEKPVSEQIPTSSVFH